MEKKENILLNVMTSLFLGLLIGFILGLSLSETVGAIASILFTAAVVFIGFYEKKRNPGEDETGSDYNKTNLIRAMFLSIFCIFGIIGGVYARTHNLLGVSEYKNEYEGLKNIGFSEEDALEIIRQRITNSAQSVGLINKAAITGLYSNDDKVHIENLNPANFTDVEKLIDVFKGISDKSAIFVEFMEKYFDEDDYMDIMQLHWNFIMSSR